MLKLSVSILFFIIGITELVLAFHGGAREALLRNSILRAGKTSAPIVFFLAGLSALVMGFSILFFNRLW